MSLLIEEEEEAIQLSSKCRSIQKDLFAESPVPMKHNNNNITKQSDTTETTTVINVNNDDGDDDDIYENNKDNKEQNCQPQPPQQCRSAAAAVQAMIVSEVTTTTVAATTSMMRDNSKKRKHQHMNNGNNSKYHDSAIISSNGGGVKSSLSSSDVNSPFSVYSPVQAATESYAALHCKRNKTMNEDNILMTKNYSVESNNTANTTTMNAVVTAAAVSTAYDQNLPRLSLVGATVRRRLGDNFSENYTDNDNNVTNENARKEVLSSSNVVGVNTCDAFVDHHYDYLSKYSYCCPVDEYKLTCDDTSADYSNNNNNSSSRNDTLPKSKQTLNHGKDNNSQCWQSVVIEERQLHDNMYHQYNDDDDDDNIEVEDIYPERETTSTAAISNADDINPMTTTSYSLSSPQLLLLPANTMCYSPISAISWFDYDKYHNNSNSDDDDNSRSTINVYDNTTATTLVIEDRTAVNNINDTLPHRINNENTTTPTPPIALCDDDNNRRGTNNELLSTSSTGMCNPDDDLIHSSSFLSTLVNTNSVAYISGSNNDDNNGSMDISDYTGTDCVTSDSSCLNENSNYPTTTSTISSIQSFSLQPESSKSLQNITNNNGNYVNNDFIPSNQKSTITISNSLTHGNKSNSYNSIIYSTDYNYHYNLTLDKIVLKEHLKYIGTVDNRYILARSCCCPYYHDCKGNTATTTATTAASIDSSLQQQELQPQQCCLRCGDQSLLLVLDQHAVHERILLETYLNQLKTSYASITTSRSLIAYSNTSSTDKDCENNLYNTNISVQNTKIPADTCINSILATKSICADININAEEYTALLNKTELLTQKWGFSYNIINSEQNEDIDKQLMGCRLRVNQVPVLLDEPLYVADFKEFLQFIAKNRELPDVMLRPPSVNRIIASKACRRAVKFGDKISSQYAKQLLQELMTTSLPFQCAHGRPSMAPIIDMRSLLEQKALFIQLYNNKQLQISKIETFL